MTNLLAQARSAFIMDIMDIPDGELIAWPTDDVKMERVAALSDSFTGHIGAWGMRLGDQVLGEILIGKGQVKIAISAEADPLLIAKPEIRKDIDSQTEFILAQGSTAYALKAVCDNAEEIVANLKALDLEVTNNIAVEDQTGNMRHTIRIKDIPLKSAA